MATDQLCFGLGDIVRLATGLEPIKWNLVRTAGHFYNPMGFLSPIVIRFKVFLQQAVQRKPGWDQPLSENLLHTWNALVSELQCSPDMSMPRCIWNDISTEQSYCSLHGFFDASKQAYEAVVYLVIKSSQGQS